MKRLLLALLLLVALLGTACVAEMENSSQVSQETAPPGVAEAAGDDVEVDEVVDLDDLEDLDDLDDTPAGASVDEDMVDVAEVEAEVAVQVNPPDVISEADAAAEADAETDAEAETLTCTLSISCAALLDSPELLDRAKQDLIPADGLLLAPLSVSFEQGESVFDLLRRVCQEQGVHLEFVFTPGLNTAYIEGIANLYEFDAGPLSGWTYRVNSISPGYGSSVCELADGDAVEWIYSLSLENDRAY